MQIVNTRQSDISLRQSLIFIAEAFLFVLLFLVFEGYAFGVGNQTVFLQVIESLSKYPYLQNDFGVSARAFYHPFFNMSMAWLNHFAPLPLLFLLTQLVLLLFIYGTTRLLARFFHTQSAVYWFGILLMFLWAQQGVDDNVFWTNRLEGQYLAWPWILLAFSAYLRGRWAWAGFFTGVASVFHFQLGVITGIVLTAVCLLPDAPSRKCRLLHLFAGAAILGVPVFCYFFKGIFVQKFLIGPDFVPFAALRISQHMKLDLRLDLLFLLLGLLPYGLLKIQKLRKLFDSAEAHFIRRLLPLQAALILFGVLQYMDYYLHIGILSRLQFLRLLPFVYLTGVFFIARFLLIMLNSPKQALRVLACLGIFLLGPRLITYQSLRENWVYFFVTLAATLLIARLMGQREKWRVILWFGFLFLALIEKMIGWAPQNGWSFHPAPFLWDASQNSKDPWIDICRNARLLIPQEDLTISPPYLSGFAYFAKRKTFVEFKSNGAHRDTAAEWTRRLFLTTGGGTPLEDCSGMACLGEVKEKYNALKPANVENIAKIYNARFLVTESKQNYPYKKIYANSSFKIYALPAIPPRAQSPDQPVSH